MTVIGTPTVLPSIADFEWPFICMDVIKISLGELRVLKPGESPEAEETEDCVKRLNAMIASWAATEGFMLFTLTEETRALTAGTESFTIGSGADQDSVRPSRIDSRSFIRDASGNDTPINIITLAEYNSLSTKSPSNGLPADLYYDPAYPYGTVHLQPPPASGYTLHLVSEKQFTAFEDAYTSFAFPPEYLRCMGYNLAVEMAGPYNKQLSPSTVAIAQQTKKAIKGLNAASRPIPRDFSNVPCVGGGGRSFNFYSGR